MGTAAAPAAPLDLLRILAALRPAPLNLRVLADRMANGRAAAELHALAIRHLTAEHARDVTHAQTTIESAVAFVNHFGTDRFPLMTEHLPLDPDFLGMDDDDDNRFAIAYLLNGIPYRLHGFDHYEEMHELHRHTYPALIVVCALLNLYRSKPTDPDFIRSEVSGLRLVWQEHLMEQAGVAPETLEGIPPFGYWPEHFMAAVAGTEHDGANHLATVLAQTSDNVFLSWYNSEEVMEFSDPWDDEHIEAAVQLWAEAQPVLEGMTAYMQAQDHRIPQMAAELRALLDAHKPHPEETDE